MLAPFKQFAQAAHTCAGSSSLLLCRICMRTPAADDGARAYLNAGLPKCRILCLAGTAAMCIAKAHPHLRCATYDLPNLEHAARDYLQENQAHVEVTS